MGPAKCTPDPHPMPFTPSAMGPSPWCPHCLSAGSQDLRTHRPKDRGDRGHMSLGALTSLTLPALSLEPPSLGPPTPPIHSSHRGGQPPPLRDMGCCGGGHPGVHSSPSTPNPAPWERVHKRGECGGHVGGHRGHQGSGPWLCVPHCPRRAASSAQHPGARSWPQPHPCHCEWRRVGDRFWVGSQAASAKGT